MKFYKNIGIFIFIITLIVIGLNVFFYLSFYNQQIKAHSSIISKQVKICGTQVENSINDFKNDLNFYFNKFDYYQLFREKSIQNEPVRKLRQLFIKYNDLISSIEIITKEGDAFIFNGNSDNYFNKTYEKNKKWKFLLNNSVNFNNDNLIYTSILKDGNEVVANVIVKVELKSFFAIIFRQYHVNNQFFQSLVNQKGKIVFTNLSNEKVEFSKSEIILKSINNNLEDLISQKVVEGNNKRVSIISGIYPFDILGYKYGLVFSEQKSTIYDIVIKKTGLISFFTILTFIIIILIFQNLVKTLKLNELILKQRNIELEQLTFSTSHHLQEPLRKIFIFSDRLSSKLNDIQNKEEKSILNKIQGFSLNMRQMLDGLLYYSEINIKGDDFKQIDLYLLIKDLIGKYYFNKKYENQFFVGNLPVIIGDESQITTLFKHLIDNSINFADKEVPLKIEIFQGNEINNFNKVIVKDNGQGFEEKYNELVFQPFQQLNPIDGSNRSGIGLTIVKKIIERHKGNIYIQSIQGEGCIVNIEFNKNLKNE